MSSVVSFRQLKSFAPLYGEILLIYNDGSREKIGRKIQEKGDRTFYSPYKTDSRKKGLAEENTIATVINIPSRASITLIIVNLTPLTRQVIRRENSDQQVYKRWTQSILHTIFSFPGNRGKTRHRKNVYD